MPLIDVKKLVTSDILSYYDAKSKQYSDIKYAANVMATTERDGLMSKEDKNKLDTISANAKPGTITGVSVNGTSVATSGVANIKSIPANILKGAIPSAVTATTQAASDNSTKIATTEYVTNAINSLADPMVFMGTLGTDGSISSLPAASANNKGYTYKVITDGTYSEISAKNGDTFISDGSTWILIPSGDEPSGTVTNVTIKASSPIAINSTAAITGSGTRTISHANSGVTASTYGTNNSTALTPKFGDVFSVDGFAVNATGHITSASTHTVKIPNTVFGKSGSTASIGLVPAPSTTAGTTKYLREDGTWQVPPNVDTKATQTNTTASADYRLALSYNANDTTETQTLRKSGNFLANPATGEFYAKGYRRIDITGQTLDINTLNLSAGSPMIMRYIEKTSGGAANITNIPVVSQPFILNVELIRWASNTDYITKQTFVSVGGKYFEYIRYCNSGTWENWVRQVFTDSNVNQTLTTNNASYPLLLAPSGQTATANASAYFGTGITFNPSTKTLSTTTFNGALSGNASTATALTTSAGSAAQPVYFSEGKPVACTYPLGQGFGTCSTAANDTAKIATISGYKLITGGIVAIKFTYAVPAGATLNINGAGAKKMQYRGGDITVGVIREGDIATFIYTGAVYLLLSRNYATSSSCISGGDYNNCIDEGHYEIYGNASTPTQNAPDGKNTDNNYYVFVQRRNSGWLVQTAISVRNPLLRYTRGLLNNVWSAWTKLELTDTKYAVATTSANGLMSANDKKILDILKTPYATCATARSTAAKVATLANFTLTVGTTIAVKFTATDTNNPASGNLTLNVNNTGAKTIGYFRNGSKAAFTYAGSSSFCNNQTHIFTYDGTYWLCMDWNSDTNTDTKVTNTLNNASKAYLTGTTNAATNTGTQVFDNGVYLTTTAGQMNATSYKVAEKVTMNYSTTENCLNFVFS